jgi:hypothetical protein
VIRPINPAPPSLQFAATNGGGAPPPPRFAVLAYGFCPHRQRTARRKLKSVGSSGVRAVSALPCRKAASILTKARRSFKLCIRVTCSVCGPRPLRKHSGVRAPGGFRLGYSQTRDTGKPGNTSPGGYWAWQHWGTLLRPRSCPYFHPSPVADCGHSYFRSGIVRPRPAWLRHPHRKLPRLRGVVRCSKVWGPGAYPYRPHDWQARL